MSRLDSICDKIAHRQYELSRHAVGKSVVRDISIAELEQAVMNHSELIEDYPNDKYGPSCLILGFTHAGRPIHVQCSYPNRPLIKVVTLYEPDPALWIGFRILKTD